MKAGCTAFASIDGVTSAGFVLRADREGLRAEIARREDPAAMWRSLLTRYPTIDASFADATPLFPVAFRSLHSTSSHAGRGRAMAAVAARVCLRRSAVLDGHRVGVSAPSSGWRLSFEQNKAGRRVPTTEQLARYDALLNAEADQIDRLVAGAYEAMAHFDLFAAQAMIYFTAVSFAEVRQRLLVRDADAAAWSGFVGVGDSVLEPLPGESLQRLRRHRTAAIIPRRNVGSSPSGCVARSRPETSAGSASRHAGIRIPSTSIG